MAITIALSRLLIDCRVELLYLRKSEFEIHVDIYKVSVVHNYYFSLSHYLQQFAKDIPGISDVSHFN